MNDKTDHAPNLTTDFDLDSLRLKQDFSETLGVQKCGR